MFVPLLYLSSLKNHQTKKTSLEDREKTEVKESKAHLGGVVC